MRVRPVMAVWHRETRSELRKKLETIDAEIAAHPLSSDRVLAAHLIVDGRGKKSDETIERELAERELPGLAELGTLQVRHTAGWWRLHRRRRKTVERIERTGG